MALDTIESRRHRASAYDRLARIHFDYAAVSKFDEKAKKLIPFWTFMSRNLPMQISEMWTKPKVYAWYNSFVRNFAGEPGRVHARVLRVGRRIQHGRDHAGLRPAAVPPTRSSHRSRVTEDVDSVHEGAARARTSARCCPTSTPSSPPRSSTRRGRTCSPADSPTTTDWTKAEARWTRRCCRSLALLGQTKKGADGVYIQDKGMNAMRRHQPAARPHGRAGPRSRLASIGDPSRQLEALLRTFGAPIRTLSPQQQQSTRRRSTSIRRRARSRMERWL